MSYYGATVVCTDEPEYDFMKLERKVSKKSTLVKSKVVILTQNEKASSKKS